MNAWEIWSFDPGFGVHPAVIVSAQDRAARKPLVEITAQGPAQVASVFERDRKLLEYLDGLGIRPGAKLRMVSRNYDDTLTLKVGVSS